MNDNIESRVFGHTRQPTDAEREAIKRMVKKFPIYVFREFNRMLKPRYMKILIEAKREIH